MYLEIARHQLKRNRCKQQQDSNAFSLHQQFFKRHSKRYLVSGDHSSYATAHKPVKGINVDFPSSLHPMERNYLHFCLFDLNQTSTSLLNNENDENKNTAATVTNCPTTPKRYGNNINGWELSNSRNEESPKLKHSPLSSSANIYFGSHCDSFCCYDDFHPNSTSVEVVSMNDSDNTSNESFEALHHTYDAIDKESALAEGISAADKDVEEQSIGSYGLIDHVMHTRVHSDDNDEWIVVPSVNDVIPSPKRHPREYNR